MELDIVVDRSHLSCLNLSDLDIYIQNVHNLLVSNGVFMYIDVYGSLMSEQEIISAQNGGLNFYDEQLLRSHLKNLEIERFYCRNEVDLITDNVNQFFDIQCRKAV